METTAPIRTASLKLDASFAAVRALDLPATGEPARRAALEVAEIVRNLDADDEVVVAAMLQPLLDENILDRESTGKRFGEEPARLARSLESIGPFRLAAGLVA